VRWTRPAAWPAPRRAGLGAATIAVAVALTPAVVLGDASAVAHHGGIEAWRRGDAPAARDQLVLAAALDRWHPAPPKALAVAAEAAGDLRLARRAAERAVLLNPGDGRSWTNLAILCERLDDPDCRLEAAERAAARASFLGPELANAAIALDELGRPDEADDAYVGSLLAQRLTAFGLEWPRDVRVGDATLDEDFGALFELNRLLGWWAAGEPIDPEAVADPAVRALAHAMNGDRAAAEPLLDEALRARPDDPLPWQLAIVLRDHWGEPIDAELRAWRALTGRPFPGREDRPAVPPTTDDIASFRRYPADELVAGAERLETDPIWPWVLAQTLP
jgi:Flp pilus assembly protein TadD